MLTPVCVMWILGTAVSKKHEVDEGYWSIDPNKKLTDEQRKFRKTELDNEGNKLDNKVVLFAIAGLISFVFATTLLVKRTTLTTP